MNFLFPYWKDFCILFGDLRSKLTTKPIFRIFIANRHSNAVSGALMAGRDGRFTLLLSRSKDESCGPHIYPNKCHNGHGELQAVMVKMLMETLKNTPN